jgi:hypothetical protein
LIYKHEIRDIIFQILTIVQELKKQNRFIIK